MTTTMSNGTGNVRAPLRFPPFPQPPEGRTIIPFSQFKERGIKRNCGEANPEIDILGIPTVAIGGPKWDREMDECKTRSLFQKHTGVRVPRTRPAHMSREWYKEWEATEASRRVYTSFDTTISPQDRFLDASQAFYNTRRNLWPAVENKTSIYDMWMQVGIFTGLRYAPPIWQRTDQPEPEDSDSDAEAPPKFKKRVHHLPYAVWGEPTKVSSDEEVQALIAGAKRRKVEKLDAFLADPARGTAVFLSSHMIDQAFIYYKHLLDGTPQLLRFFYEFVLRENVFREPELRAGFERAVEVTKRAFIDLPATSVLSHILPDRFGDSCKRLFALPAADPVDVLDELMKGGAVLTEDIDVDQWDATDDWEGTPSAGREPEPDPLPEILGDELAKKLPSSYMRGSSESSMRRIVSVDASSPSVFGGRLARVVLSPWPNYHPYDPTDPTDNAGERMYNTPEVEGDTNRVDEDITVLVEPSIADKLIVGMGIGGKWVNVVPTDGVNTEGFWFVEEMKKAIPSYYTA
ncbi:hypothetical protein EV715DRAFT_204104 [Schizophyllum commune]